jgi:hypothetical protein
MPQPAGHLAYDMPHHAKSPTSTKSHSTASKKPTLWSVNAVIVCTLSSLAIFAYERTLVPLYGSEPTHFHINKVVLGALVASALVPARWSTDVAFLLGTALLSALPASAYWVAVHTSRWRDPLWGPVVTHLLLIAPVVYVLASIVKRLNVSPTLAIGTTSGDLWFI